MENIEVKRPIVIKNSNHISRENFICFAKSTRFMYNITNTKCDICVIVFKYQGTEKEKVIDVKYFNITNLHKMYEYMQEKANEQAKISFDVIYIY